MGSKICPNCGWANQGRAKFCAQCGTILTTPVELKAGETLNNGRYVIVKQLGKGGMGATYLAKDTQAFERLCVIKIMLPYFDPDDPQDFQAALNRFEQEAKALAELGTHPNIPNLLHWFEEGGQFFLVMEFIEGENLKDKLCREGVQPIEQVIDWGISLSKTLEFMAGKGYVHHDIKPDNIILHAGSGEPILVDFGTVKTGKLAVKASFGTQGYAPPEQMMPPYQTEHRSDVFALAATLYHLLTGDHPAQNLWKFPKLTTIPQPLQDVLRQALNLDVHQRPTAKEFREKLEQCLRPQPITGPFVSKSGEKVDKPEDWLDFAEKHWDEAAEHLQRGDVEVWLESIGRFDLAIKAEEAREKFPIDRNAALQTFLESLNPYQAPRPELQVNPTKLDFGYLSKSKTSSQWLKVTNTGQGYLFGEIVTREGWIEVNRKSISCLPGVSQTVQVTVDANRLPFGENHQGAIIISTNGGTLSVPVRVVSKPSDESRPSDEPANLWATWALVFALMPCLCYVPISLFIGLGTAIFNVFTVFFCLASMLAAILFGIVGLRKARELEGHGRGSAIAAILIATIVLMVGTVAVMKFESHNSKKSSSQPQLIQPPARFQVETQSQIEAQTTSKPALVWRFCWNCNGTGNEGACFWCDGRGYTTCSSCEGHGVTPLGERCASCDGKGMKTCWSCEGRGIRICSTCDGTGKVWGYICNWCKGTGRSREPCWSCNGRGYERCFSCLGRGLCGSCVGKGYFLGIVCSSCGGSGRCKYCSGSGWEVCGSCKGTGLKKCSGCDGKGIILRR